MTTAGTPENLAAAADGPPLSAVLFQMTTGTMVSQAVSVAARLGVADVLADGPRSVEEIAELVEADPSALYRLLRAVADLGLFTELKNRQFELAPLVSRSATRWKARYEVGPPWSGCLSLETPGPTCT